MPTQTTETWFDDMLDSSDVAINEEKMALLYCGNGYAALSVYLEVGGKDMFIGFEDVEKVHKNLDMYLPEFYPPYSKEELDELDETTITAAECLYYTLKRDEDNTYFQLSLWEDSEEFSIPNTEWNKFVKAIGLLIGYLDTMVTETILKQAEEQKAIDTDSELHEDYLEFTSWQKFEA